MRPSFRLRLALSLVLLTGLALGGFGAQAWWLIRSAKIERIDAELRAWAERAAARPQGGPGWAATSIEIAQALAPDDLRLVQLLVVGPDTSVIYRSSAWPETLRPASLTWPALPRAVVRPAAAGAASGVSLPREVPDTPLTLPTPTGLDSPEVTGPLWDGSLKGPLPGPTDARTNPEPRTAEGPPRRPPSPPAFDGSRPPLGRPLGPRDDPRLGPPPEPPRGWPEAPLGEPMDRASGRAPARASPGAQTEQEGQPTPAPASAATRESADPASPPERLGVTAPRRSAAAALTPETEPEPGPPPASGLMERPVGATSWRIAMATTAQHRIAVAFNEEALNAEMAVVRNAFLLALPAVLVLIAAGAWWMATRALRPVHELAETIQTVTAQGLDQRVAASAADREFADLIEVFNAMLERLERGFRQASRFSADAAHELKTPLAILQGELERLIQSAEDGSSIQVALCGILDEVRRLSVISRKLLLLSLADSGGLRLERRQLDLSRRLTELVEDTQLLAPALRVTGDIPAGLAVEVDANLVEQIFHNLVSNAIKYNIEGGWIHVAASRSAREVFVSVSNSSHGLSGEDAARVFERFYRGDRAHGRAVDGVGLGLSLSREIARAHGGELTLESGSDHRIFVLLTLPYASPGDPMPSPAMPAQSAEGTASAQTLQAVRAPSTSIRKPVGL